MKKITIGICSVGSGVGQSVIDSCKLFHRDVRAVGLGNDSMAFGGYECDKMRLIPSYYSNDYIEILTRVAVEEKIDVLIPGHDEEAYVLAKNRQELALSGIRVLVSSAELIACCRDKGNYKNAFYEASDYFVKTFSIDELKKGIGVVFPVIKKPRHGFASKEVSIIAAPEEAVDETGFIYQEIAAPLKDDQNFSRYSEALKFGKNLQLSEISVQLLFDTNSELTACCATRNRLNNGVPVEIIPFSVDLIQSFIDNFCLSMRRLGAFGPVNLQGRITDKGFKVFEINPRFTGITGLRAKLGFNEVEYCLFDLVFGQSSPKPRLCQRYIGVRQVASKKVRLIPHIDKSNVRMPLDETRGKRNLLITGSSGLLGRLLLDTLLAEGKFNVFTLDREKNNTLGVAGAYTFDSLDRDAPDFSCLDIVFHGAFARPHHDEEEIYESIQISFDLLRRCVKFCPEKIVFISSQSVYGFSHSDIFTEVSRPTPFDSYGRAKLTVENHIRCLSDLMRDTRFTILRLASVMGPQEQFVKHEAYSRIIAELSAGNEVSITTPLRKISKVDYRDAVEALHHFLHIEAQDEFLDIVNIGPKKTLGLGAVVAQASDLFSNNELVYTSSSSLMADNLEISSQKAKEKYGWQARFDIKDTINAFKWGGCSG